MKRLPERSVPASPQGVLRLLLILVVWGGLGCSLSSGKEEQPENLKNRRVAIPWVEMKRGMMSPLMEAWGWSVTGSLAAAREFHTATLLPSGKVLVAGGDGGAGQATSIASAEVYDPATGAWSPTGSMATARLGHTATLLPSGKVLVVGGFDTNGGLLASAEVYDPATAAWSPTGSLTTARRFHTATRLPSGKVLVVGGEGGASQLASAEVYDPATGVWSPTGSLATARYYHTATLLPSGKVLVTGGDDIDYAPLASAEVYDPATAAWNSTGALATARDFHTATLLPSGKVLVAGGGDSNGLLSSAEVYDPATGVWSLTGALATARFAPTATLLLSGKVLVTGGGSLSSTEEYDPATGAWNSTGALARNTDRYYHTATLLPSGKVLVAGGAGQWGAPIADAEVYHVFTVVVAPANNSITSDSTPTYGGTAEAGSTVAVIVDGVAVGTITAEATGNWSLTPTTPLADGTHTVKAFATDASNYTSPDSNTNTFTVDTTAPAAPVVSAPINGSLISSDKPTYSGVAEAGSTVTVIADGAVVGTTTVDGSGTWSLMQPVTLADGSHTVKASATDAAGNTSADSNTSTFTVDATAPAAPVVLAPADTSVTNNNHLSCSGTAEAGSFVTVFVDGVAVGVTPADGAGQWVLTPTTAWSEGAHTVKASAMDAAGNPSADSNTLTFTVDTTAPAAPVVMVPANGSTIYASMPAYSGTAEAHSTVTVLVDDTPVGTTTADVAGTWSFTFTTALPGGPHTVKVLATDATGNTSVVSGTHTFTVSSDPGTGGWRTVGALATARSGHTATLLPSGQVLVTGGSDSSSVFASAEVFDPSTGGWSTVNALSTARSRHTATQLPSGKVLVTGGRDSTNALASSEVYDPATGKWSLTGALSTARQNHTATQLPSGKVLVIGGSDSTGVLASVEVYDPDTETWSTTGALSTARENHTATLLLSGKVLVTGGQGSTGVLSSSEVYDPATGTWSATTPLATPRSLHTATRLTSGQVLVTGGQGATAALTSAEVYDPATEAWSPTQGALNAARAGHTATLLPSGRVLVAGRDGFGTALAAVEVYNPSTKIWSPVSTLATARGNQTATLLLSGQLLLVGGRGSEGGVLASAEVISALGVATPKGSLGTVHAQSTVVLLPDGRVLVAGGSDSHGSSMASAEIYNPATGLWTPTAPMGTPRASATATLLPSGEVLIAGGSRLDSHSLRALNPIAVLQSAELFNPATGLWSPTGSLTKARAFHSALLLPTGQVLLTGGIGEDGTPLSDAELYDPKARTWRSTGSMNTARREHVVVQLPAGQVLVAGGLNTQGDPLASAEVYDPKLEKWTETAPMSTPRSSSTAAMLPESQVLVAGGTNGSKSLATAERYEPATGQWSDAGSMHTARQSHAALLLPSGRVLIVGGKNDTQALAEVELYDPVSRTWEQTSPLIEPRKDSLTVPLPTGTVLVIGGQNSNGSSTTTEEYDEFGALRPRVNPLPTPQNPHTQLVLHGEHLKSPPGTGSLPRVRLQTIPDAALIDLAPEDFSDTSVKVTLPEVPDGYYLIFVLANELAGGQVVHVDGTAPGAPTVTRFVRTPQPFLEGSAEPDSTVQVSLDDRVVGTAQASEKGAWTLPLRDAPEDGWHTALATATDAAGNVSLASLPLTWNEDTQPPAAPQVNPLAEFISVSRPTLSGMTEPGSTVTVSLDGKEEGTVPGDTEGRWSFTSSGLEDGEHKASVTATDSAGNMGPASVLTFTVDTQAPATPEVLTPQEGTTLDLHSATSSGTAEPNCTITVSVDGKEIGTAAVDSTGAWSVLLPTELKEGEHTLSATTMDAARNVSPSSAVHRFTVSSAISTSDGDSDTYMMGGGLGCTVGSGDPTLVLLGWVALRGLRSRRRA